MNDARRHVRLPQEPHPPASPTKRCKECREVLPLSHFQPRKNGGQGVVATCHECVKTRRANEEFKCSRCLEVKAGTEFYQGGGGEVIRQPCIACRAVSARDATRERRVQEGRSPYHILSEVDTIARTATCRECGPTHVYATGSKTGRGWRCGRRSDEVSEEWYAANADVSAKHASVNWHRIRDVRGEAVRATCSQCGDVPVKWNNAGRYFVCAAPKRRREKANVERRKRRLAQYGLTTEQYDRMLEEQGGQCAICGGDTVRADSDGALVVDHDHETGLVRALLCQLCNTGIGALREDPTIFLAAMAYLEKHKQQGLGRSEAA